MPRKKAIEVHYDDARRLDFDIVNHDAHRAKCDALGIRRVEFFENGMITAPREVPLGIRRIVALLEAAPLPGDFDRRANLPVDKLFAAYHAEFSEDIAEPEKLRRILSLREEDAPGPLKTSLNERRLNYAHLTFVSIFNSARPNVFQFVRGTLYLQTGYKDMLAKWKQGSSA